MRYHFLKLCGLTSLLLVTGCSGESPDRQQEEVAPRFQLLPPQSTGVDFRNDLTEGPNTNVIMYEYFYNGGGVATADFDGDGRSDLYFTANMAPNKLYLNRGDMRFEDVTAVSGSGGRPGPWATGVAVVDINADGRPDLYLSYSGMLPAEKRRNELLVNLGPGPDGVPRFRESARAYGLDLPSFSNQGYFFDYDGDGDLDALILNHNPQSLPILNEEKTRQLLATDDPERGLRLLRNDNGRYTDVTERAGVNGSALSYGLGLAISDLNGDGRPDFYLSNDYEVPDYLYINRGDGTFQDELGERLGHSSHFSMGSDIADVDNDGQPDIFTLDMLPADNRRRKLLMADDNRSRHDLNRASGYTEQTMRNMLQLNRGDGSFAEIGQQAGVAATDWSWSALLVDLDNDGFKDLHVTNGYVRDYTNMDFIKYMDDFVKARGRIQRNDVLELLKEMPASEVSNYVFANRGGAAFADVTAAWGLQRPSNSNGAVAVDLDDDGDLDLVVNNLNQPAFIYENTTSGRHYLQVAFEGPEPNGAGIGASVTLAYGDALQRQEFYPNRGYLSSGPFYLHFGLGDVDRIDRLTVRWPDGSLQELTDVAVDQRLRLRSDDAGGGKPVVAGTAAPALQEITAPVAYTDVRSTFRDFDRQPLLRRQLSDRGPVLHVADLNVDGYDDLVIGGDGLTVALSNTDQTFTTRTVPLPGSTGEFRVTALASPDVNEDGVPDLYVGRGGYHGLEAGRSELTDLLFLNDGNGDLRAANPADLPATATGAATVGEDAAGQVLFVGAAVTPGRYPEGGGGTVYRIRNGALTALDSGPLVDLGPVTAAAWSDLDGDGSPELIVVGEWSPVRIFTLSSAGEVAEATENYFDNPVAGWWNSLAVADLNGDGRPDLVVGNEGTNNLFGASTEHPVTLEAGDYDGNGSVDPLLSYYLGGVRYPDATRDELIGQLAGQRKRYPDYKSYAGVTAEELMGGIEGGTTQAEADELATCVFLSGQDKYAKVILPSEAQRAPVHAIAVADVNADGHPDLLLAGNERGNRLRYGSSDANHGLLLLNDGKGNFLAEREELGLRGSVRSIVHLGDRLIIGTIGEQLRAFAMPEPSR